MTTPVITNQHLRDEAFAAVTTKLQAIVSRNYSIVSIRSAESTAYSRVLVIKIQLDTTSRLPVVYKHLNNIIHQHSCTIADTISFNQETYIYFIRYQLSGKAAKRIKFIKSKSPVKDRRTDRSIRHRIEKTTSPLPCTSTVNVDQPVTPPIAVEIPESDESGQVQETVTPVVAHYNSPRQLQYPFDYQGLEEIYILSKILDPRHLPKVRLFLCMKRIKTNFLDNVSYLENTSYLKYHGIPTEYSILSSLYVKALLRQGFSSKEVDDDIDHMVRHWRSEQIIALQKSRDLNRRFYQ